VAPPLAGLGVVTVVVFVVVFAGVVTVVVGAVTVVSCLVVDVVVG